MARTARGENAGMRVLRPRSTCKDKKLEQSNNGNEAKGVGNFVVNMDMMLPEGPQDIGNLPGVGHRYGRHKKERPNMQHIINMRVKRVQLY